MTDLQPFDTSEIPLINQAIRLAEEIRLGEGIDDQELMKARSALLDTAAKHLIHRASRIGYILTYGGYVEDHTWRISRNFQEQSAPTKEERSKYTRY